MATQKLDSETKRKWYDIRTRPRRFGISFVVPDRVAVEISDRKRIRGKHPIRIVRIPSDCIEFYRIVEEAEEESPPLKNWEKEETAPNPRKSYHRSRLNDWHPQVFYFQSSIHRRESMNSM